MIVNPILAEAYQHDWYYPPTLPSEIVNSELYAKAVNEGWHEWIETPLDFEAMKHGYVYDLSRDVDSRPIYWYDGAWLTHDGKRVEVEDEEEAVGYVGRGDHTMRFCESFLYHTKEPLDGDPYRFLPWMRKIVAPFYGWVKGPSDYSHSRHRRFQYLYVAIAKKNGKLLAADTLIPTPSGWTYHGNLRVGDQVFDSHGAPCKVIAVHPDDVADYEVEFTNGEKIRCNGEHLWVTTRLDDRGYTQPEVRSTDDIAATLTRPDGALRHRLDMHDGIDCQDRDLPVDPWVLGYWLGDGDKNSGRITVGDQDREFSVNKILDRGYETNTPEAKTFTVLGLKKSLRRLQILGYKNIPGRYLRASRTQRLELLQGLMDSDGTISKRGSDISISQKSPVLAKGICELLASLGLKYSIKYNHRVCHNSPEGKKGTSAFHIQFSAFRDTHPVFSMPRKLARMRYLRNLKMSSSRSRHVHIKSVTKIAPVVGNCITVSSDDGTYLCGSTMIPTHNSALLSVLANYQLVGDGTPKAQVYCCACDRNQARIIYDEASHMVKGSPTLSDIVTIVDSRGRLTHPDSGSFYAVLSADAHRNDGVDSSCSLIDEIHRHPNRKLFTVMERAGQARPEPVLAVITTYGPSLGDGSIWAEIHNEGKAQMAGTRPDSWRNMVFVASSEPIIITATEACSVGSTRIPVSRLDQPVDVGPIKFDLTKFDLEGELEVNISEPAKRFQQHITVEPLTRELPAFSEAAANEEWRTEHSVRRSNPSVGVVFPMERLMQKVDESRTPEKEAETKQLNFNIVSGSGRKWLSSAAWTACASKQVQPKKLIGRPCFGGLDFSFGGDLVGFGLAFPSWDLGEKFIDVKNPRVDLLSWGWVPDEQIEEREKVEQFPYRHHAATPYLFDDMGCVRLCRGRVVDFPQIINEILAILSKFQVVAVAYDPNYAGFGIPKVEEAGFTCVAHKQGAVSMSPPCKRFSELVYKGQLAHGNNPLLSRAVEGAQLHPPDRAGNTYLSKGGSHNKIDVLVSQVMAVGFCCDPPVGYSGAWASTETGVWG